MQVPQKDLSRSIDVYNDPDTLALRTNPLQQLWREHMLSRSIIENGLYTSGRFVLIYPSQNHQCGNATNIYQSHLVSDDPNVSGFQVITLEDCVEALRVIGDNQVADALYERYLDFGRIDRKIFESYG